MALDALLIWLFIGAVSGWLAGIIVQGGGFGVLGDIIVGILGACVAGYMLPRFGVRIGTGLWEHVASGTIGGVVVVVIIMLLRKR